MSAFDQAIEECCALGVRLMRVNGEYRVNFMGGKEATAYYTNDLQDAVNTAIAMVKYRREDNDNA
jgi:hypothetical protein